MHHSFYVQLWNDLREFLEGFQTVFSKWCFLLRFLTLLGLAQRNYCQREEKMPEKRICFVSNLFDFCSSGSLGVDRLRSLVSSEDSVFFLFSQRTDRDFARRVAGTVSLPSFSVFFRSFPVFFRFLPFRRFLFLLFFFGFRFFLFSSFFCFVSSVSFSEKRGDTVRETPFCESPNRVFSAHLSEGTKTLRSLRKERQTQKSSLMSKEHVDIVCYFLGAARLC